MSIEKLSIIGASSKHVGNAAGFGTVISLIGEKLSLMSVQEQVAIAVGISAVFSYLTSALCTILKTRKELKESRE